MVFWGWGRGVALVKVVGSSRENFVHDRGMGVVEEMARRADTGACPYCMDWPVRGAACCAPTVDGAGMVVLAGG